MDREFDLAPVLELAAAHLVEVSPERDDLDVQRTARNRRPTALDLPSPRAPGPARAAPVDLAALTLTRDPDTDAELDPEAPDAWSPAEAELPLPTVRSLAYEAVVGYARWVLARTGERVGTDVSAVDEATRLIEAGLDPVAESSPSVRATLARALPTLFWIDPDWTERQLTALFATRPRLLADAAWSGFLAHEPVSLPLLGRALTADIYAAGIELIAGADGFSQRRREQLGRQLLSAAVFGLDGHETPWLAWLAREDPHRRAAVVEWFGRFLSVRSDEQAATPPAVAQLGKSASQHCPMAMASSPPSEAGSRRTSSMRRRPPSCCCRRCRKVAATLTVSARC